MSSGAVSMEQAQQYAISTIHANGKILGNIALDYLAELLYTKFSWGAV